MKITIESTKKIVRVDGVEARIWEGRTESGIPVRCYVTRIATPASADNSEFVRELEEHRAPSPEVQAIPARLAL